MMNQKPAHAVPLASARQHPENQKENQAGHSPERAVEGQKERGAQKTCPVGHPGKKRGETNQVRA